MFSVIFLPLYVSCAPASVLSLQHTQTGAPRALSCERRHIFLQVFVEILEINKHAFSAVNKKGPSPRNMFPIGCVDLKAFLVKFVC